MAATQQMKMWELAGDNPDCRISPFAWRVRLTLALKSINYESIPWRFVEKDAIKPFEKVPVLEYNGKRMGESLDICRFLDKEFPEPSMFKTNCSTGDAGTDFVYEWSNSTMLKAIFPIVLVDVAEHLTPEDKKYFVESREKMFGTKLENVVGNVEEKVQSFRTVLEPMRQMLKDFKWLGGTKISFADISVAANFLWCRAVSKTHLLEKDDPIYEWRERIFKEFDSTISNTFGYPV